MGLDMYLYSEEEYKEYKKKLSKCDPESEEYWNIHPPDELIYWRKAYAIDCYFCKVGEEIIEATKYKLTKDDLADLLIYINIILNENNYSKVLMAELFLPNENYDESYFNDLEYTKNRISNILTNTDIDSFIYYASW